MRIGLLGLGTVGTGVFEIIENRKEKLQRIYGESIEIAKILVNNKEKKREVTGAEGYITTDAYEILDDASIDVIVEVIGGCDKAYEYIRCALEQGKHVVTANKAIVALHMKELVELARKKNKAFLFEASVAGGIPLLSPLRQRSLLNDFYEIKGILNGTSNFILTKMTEENLDFKQALKSAQRLGYAETDPTDDIKGGDVARKLAILASIAFQKDIRLKNVHYRGIKHVDQKDIEYLKDQGYTVKFFGKAIANDKKVSALVEPVLFPHNTQFEKVKNSFNMVSVRGDSLEELRFYGEGAGKDATANAVLADILDILSGAYQKDGVVIEEEGTCSGESLIKGKYFIRVTLGSSLNSCKLLELTHKNQVPIISLSKITLKRRNFITERVSADHIQGLIEDLKQLELSFFIARIEEE